MSLCQEHDVIKMVLKINLVPPNMDNAWRIPGTGEPGGLPSMGSHRVGHDWSDLAAAAATSLLHTMSDIKYITKIMKQC